MTESCTIIIPLPARVLSPNGQHGHWARRAAAMKSYRRKARIAAQNERIETGPWEMVAVTAVFFHKVKRRRDDINALAMLKSAFDGIVDAGLAKDDDSDHWRTNPPTFKIDKDNPRVELTIERVNK